MADEPIINTAPAAVVPDPATSAREDRHQAMGAMLTDAIREGKGEVPEIPPPLVCKPQQLESWRVFKIMAEFVDGFELLRKYGLTVTFFGSARCSFDSAIYQSATQLAGRLAKAGYAVITGGSSGIMEAANKGAFEAGGASVGLNIRLDMDQALNKYVTDSMVFDHFFVRKVMLAFASEVYIYFPGGYGTLDEFTEILTLVQTKKIKPVPIVLFGREYWTPIVEGLFKKELYEKDHAIDEADLSLYVVVDTVDEAYDYILAHVQC